VTEESCHPGVSVCLISGTGSAVREVQGVFSVFFLLRLHVLTAKCVAQVQMREQSRDKRQMSKRDLSLLLSLLGNSC
jgi:hypothetical protein